LNVAITDVNSPTSDFCVNAYGYYEFMWTQENGTCSCSDIVGFYFYEEPTVTASLDAQPDCDALIANLTATVTYSPSPNVNYSNGWWKKTCGPGLITFVPDSASQTVTVEADCYGCYCFVYHEENGSCVVESDTVHVCFYQEPIAEIITQGADICGYTATIEAIPFVYAPCESFDTAYWIQESGPGTSTFVPGPTAAMVDVTVSMCGTYVYGWVEENGPFCADTAYVTFGFFETPTADAGGPYGPTCDTCVTLAATPWTYTCSNGVDTNYWEVISSNMMYTISDYSDPAAEICREYWSEEGFVELVWHEVNGPCSDSDTTMVEFFEMPWAPYFCSYDTVICESGYQCYYLCMMSYPSPWTIEWTVMGGPNTTWQIGPSNDYAICVNWGDNCPPIGMVCATVTTENGCEATTCIEQLFDEYPEPVITGPNPAMQGELVCYSTQDDPCWTYDWVITNGAIVSGIGTHEVCVIWDVCCDEGCLQVHVTDTCVITPCSDAFSDWYCVDLIPFGSWWTLSGQVRYDNNYGTLLDGLDLELFRAVGTPVGSTTTATTYVGSQFLEGYYAFESLNDDNFDIVPGNNLPFPGCNATDALAIQIHTVTPFLAGLRLKAGDVNASGDVNATDALYVLMRTVNQITSFPAGIWAFDNVTQTISGADLVYDFMAIGYGDVNGSNIPTGNKDQAEYALIYEDVQGVTVGGTIEIPVRVSSSVELGAMTVFMTYNTELIDVEEIVSPAEGILTNVADGRIAISWADIDGIRLAGDDVLFTVRATVLGNLNDAELFALIPGTEFADLGANVRSDFSLKTDKLSTDVNVVGYSLGQNYPNPFDDVTEITYTLPEAGKVTLKVLNMHGVVVENLVNGSREAGSYKVTFTNSELKAGVYIYVIEVEGATEDFRDTKRMTIVK
jgi:hypothetical protein